MSNQYIIYNFHAKIQGTRSQSEVTVDNFSLTKSSTVTVVENCQFCCHSKPLKVIQLYTAG